MIEPMYTQDQVQQMMLMMRNVMASPVGPAKLDSGIAANPSDSSAEEEDKPVVTIMINGMPMTITGDDATKVIQLALNLNQNNQPVQIPQPVQWTPPAPVSQPVQAVLPGQAVQPACMPENNGLDQPSGTSCPLFRDYAESYFNDFLIGKTSGTYIKECRGFLKNHIFPVIGEKQMKDIETIDIQKIMDRAVNTRDKSCGPLSVKTKKGILTLITSILDTAAEDGYINRNPARSKRIVLKGKEPREVPSWEEWEWARLYTDVLPRLTYQQDRLFLLIDMFHGLRKCEISALTWQDFDLDAGYMYVRHSVQWATETGMANRGRLKPPKTSNGVRAVKISKYVMPHLLRADKSKPFLIYGITSPSDEGTEVPSYHTVEAVIQRIRLACKKCGLRDYKSHEIRHTVVTLDCEAEIDDKTLANNHGHYTADFSKRQYARSLTTQRERARQKSDDFMGQILALNPSRMRPAKGRAG